MFDAVAQVTETEKLPFPYNKSTYCRYEPIEKKIAHAKVLIVNDLLRYESDLSDLARRDWNGTTEAKLEFERKVSGDGMQQHRKECSATGSKSQDDDGPPIGARGRG